MIFCEQYRCHLYCRVFLPSPNVVLLTASGARFGFKATVPHILGVALGVGFIAGLTGLGIGILILIKPWLIFCLKVIAAFWILWMAWGLWQSHPFTKRDTDI